MGDSKKIIFVLTIILVILSLTTTFIAFTYVNTTPTTAPSTGSGTVRLTVIKENPEPTSTTGRVSLRVLKPEEKGE
ncbi:MAG: hypothetical protein J7K72_03440 [Candidatus Aenigmarchaeota archaeon]|nr:hypothetical protein [Candidatus Aenigmarchaeota archaeon]